MRRAQAHSSTRRDAGFLRSHRGFTLAEIVASIALIAVVGVFLVQMFAVSDGLAGKARTLDCAVSFCAAVADRWKSGDHPDSLSGIPELGGMLVADGTQQGYIGVDDEMQPCDPSVASHIVELSLAETDGGVFDLKIRVVAAKDGWQPDRFGQDPALHELHVSRYFG